MAPPLKCTIRPAAWPWWSTRTNQRNYFGYELIGSNVVLTSMRDTLGSDAADTLGGAYATDEGRWLIDYGAGGDRVASISSPVPNPTAPSPRLVHRYATGSGTTTVTVDGPSPCSGVPTTSTPSPGTPRSPEADFVTGYS